MDGDCKNCCARIGCPKAKAMGYEICPVPERKRKLVNSDVKKQEEFEPGFPWK